MLAVDRHLKPTADKHMRAGVRETETHTQTHTQCCQLDNLLDRFSNFSDPLSDFISKKRLVTNLATYSDHQGKDEKYIIL